MALKLDPKFSTKEIKKLIDARLDKIELAVINRLKFTGEKFVKNARENANFTDRTGNLRSSIGYVVLKNGEVIAESFERAGKGTDSEQGPKTAKIVIAELATNFPKGFALIVVAGMDYAAAVESLNFDVLTSSSLLAEDELKKAISGLNEKITQMQ